MSRRTVPINLNLEIAEAVARLIVQVEQRQQEVEKAKAEGKTHRYWRHDALYFSATDVEREVREACRLKVETGARCPIGRSGFRIQGLKGTTLLGRCRDVLFALVRAGKLEAHNHGRHHISGMRFRPPGVPLTEAEETNMATPREEKWRRKSIRHFKREDGKAACGADDVKRSPFSYRRGWKPRPTDKPEEVTCKRCLKLLEQGKVGPSSQQTDQQKDEQEKAG